MSQGQWIRPIGSDILTGATVLPAGVRIGSAEIGILATIGASSVQVGPASILYTRADSKDMEYRVYSLSVLACTLSQSKGGGEEMQAHEVCMIVV